VKKKRTQVFDETWHDYGEKMHNALPARLKSAGVFWTMTREDVDGCIDFFENVPLSRVQQEDHIEREYKAQGCDLNYLLGLILKAA